MKLAMIAVGITALAMSAQSSQAAWQLSCEDDPIEDHRTCHLRAAAVSVIAAAFPDGSTWEIVTVGYDHYPGSDLVFRVDQNPAIRQPVKEIGGSAELIEQMARGHRLQSRYTKWPDRTRVDNVDDLTGFAAKLQEMRKRLSEYAARLGD